MNHDPCEPRCGQQEHWQDDEVPGVEGRRAEQSRDARPEPDLAPVVPGLRGNAWETLEARRGKHGFEACRPEVVAQHGVERRILEWQRLNAIVGARSESRAEQQRDDNKEPDSSQHNRDQGQCAARA